MNQGFLGYSAQRKKSRAQMVHLAADITMTNANQYYDILSLTLEAGDWSLIGSINLAAVTGNMTVKIHDGVGNVVSSSNQMMIAGASAWQVKAHGIITLTQTTTMLLSAAGVGAGNTAKATSVSNPAGATATTFTAVPC